MREPRTRAQYTPEMKRLVREKYPLCRTYDDKLELANELGMESIHKLYNLASRLRVTRTFDEEVEGDAPALAPTRRRNHIDPSEVVFSAEDDRFLKKHFGRMLIEEIAFQRDLPESAMLKRARELKLRRPTLYWQADRVADWLGMTMNELRAREAEGLDIFSLPGRHGEEKLAVISTTSIARWLLTDGRIEAFRKAGTADTFFLDELVGSIDAIRNGASAEVCRFLSPGHTCMNPMTGIRYGLFCPKTDRHPAGGDPKCNMRDRRMDELADLARKARRTGNTLPIYS